MEVIIMVRGYVNGREVIEVERKFGDVYKFIWADDGTEGTALAQQIILEPDGEDVLPDA